MSVTEAVRPQKPACEMTPEEWDECKRDIDARLMAAGKSPIDWKNIRQPRPMTEEAREWALGVAVRLGLLPK